MADAEYLIVSSNPIVEAVGAAADVVSVAASTAGVQVAAVQQSQVSVASASGAGVRVVSTASNAPGLGETWETVAQSLKAYPAVTAFVDGVPSTVTYTTPGGTIVKTFTFDVDGYPATIVLSGDTPDGIDLTKTFTFVSGLPTGHSYS